MKKLLLFLLLACAGAFGQTTVAPMTNSKVQFFDNSGSPCSGCLLSTFAAGTTTPLATYSESTGTTLNAQPIVLDSAGRATIYLTSASYKFVLKSSVGATLWTQDAVSWLSPLSSFNGLASAGNFDLTQPTAATSGANQNSFSFCIHGTFWTGSASGDDKWCFLNTLGAGTNPTSTLSVTHSGSSGVVALVLPSVTFLNPTLSGTTTAVNIAASGTLSAGATTLGNTTTGTLGAGATSVTSMVNTGDESLSTGKVIKWNSDTGISRTAGAELSVGNGTQGDVTGTVKAARFVSNSAGSSTTAGFEATSATLPYFAWNITSGLADTHRWACGIQSAVVFGCRAVADAGTGNNWVTVSTAGANVIGPITFGAGGNVQTLPTSTDTLVGKATTDTLTNKTLTGATTGNNISILNAQGAVGPLTGNSADQVVYTYSLPANTIDTNTKSLTVRCSLTHASGTANTSLKLNINGVNVAAGSSGTTASQSISMEVEVLRTGTTTGGGFGLMPNSAIGPNLGGIGSFSIGATGLAWTSSQTVTCTFNVANTDTWSGVMFTVKQNQ